MTVVDTNVVAYLFIPGDRTEIAQPVLQADPEWLAPYLWPSKFRSVLAVFVRQNVLPLSRAQQICQEAEEFLSGHEFDVVSAQVHNLAKLSSLSTYDCEFVALAQDLNLPLVTCNRQILTAFPAAAIAMEHFGK